jgi:hypothetical protein
MIIGESPLSRISRLADRDTGTYHDRIMRTLFILKDCFYDDMEYCIDKCYQAAQACQYRQPNHLEIERLAEFVWKADKRDGSLKPEPTTDHALIAEVSKNGNLKMLKDESKCHPDSISDMLEDFYPDEDPWLCIAKDIYDTEIKRKSDWQKMDLTKHEFLLPNPLKDSTSRKADNISEVRYWTYESDQLGKNWDIHAACILNLSKKVHLRCATYSGGKSIHALFKVKNYSKDYLEHFRERIFMLGGDPSTLKPQQFCRLPGGWRTDTNQPQAILYYG